MRSIWHHPWFLIPTFLFILGGLICTIYLPYGGEIWILNNYRAEPLNTFFILATKFGEEPAWIFAILASLFWRYRYALILTITGLSLMPISYYLKHYIGVERPSTYFQRISFMDQVTTIPGVYMNSGYSSFPSGHTMSAFALFSLLALMTGRRTPMLGLALAWTALLVGVSRIFLVQHFITDVMAGIVFGLLLSDLIWQLDRRFLHSFKALDGCLLKR